MRLVQTLVVRDEVDIIDAQLAYHLNAGVDFVIATDHDSQDGTAGILEEYERGGYLRLIRERGEVREGAWRTRMARLAASEHGADWVINTDADEFWLPRTGTLRDTFDAVPPRFGVVWAVSRHFVPRPEDGRPFWERMVVGFSAEAALNDPTSPYRPHGKAAHRGDPEIVVRHGSHRVETARLVPLPHWHPFDVLHFPFRSLEQYERKTVRRARGDSRLGQYVRGLQAREQGRVAETYGALVVGDDLLERSRGACGLVVDRRLEQALGSLRTTAGSRTPTGAFSLPAPGRRPPLAGVARRPGSAVADAAAFRDAETVRIVRSLDDLDARLVRVERRLWARRRARSSRGGLSEGLSASARGTDAASSRDAE